MRALRILAISASVFLAPSLALADFQTTGSAPASTLPAFQAQATPSATATASISNPQNYYGTQANIQPGYAQPQAPYQAQYTVTPLPNNGADPGVGPVVIDGQNPSVVPTVIEGQKHSLEFKQVGYGYAPVTADTTPATTTAPVAAAPVYGTQPATYAMAGQQAYAPAPNPYASPYPQAQATYAQPQPQTYAPQGYAPYSQQAPASASGYGLSGYAPTYGAPQAASNPGMLNNGTSASYGTNYNSTYTTANSDTQAYTGTAPSAAYGSQGYSGSYGAQAYPSAPTAAPPTYGSNSGAYPSYGSQYNATPTPQQPYGYNGAYQGQGGYAPQPQPQYAPAPQAYAPAPQAYAPAPQQYQYQQPQYQQPQYAAPAPSPAPQADYGNQGYGGYAPYNAAPPPSSSYDAPAPRYSNMSDKSKRNTSAWGDNSPSLSAVPGGRMYVALRTGIGFPNETEFTDLVANFKTTYDTSWQLGGAVGWEFPSLFGSFLLPRTELEANYLQQSVDKHDVGGVSVSNPNAFGNTDSLRVFVNGYFDIDTPWRRWFTPYIGAGVGLGYVDYDRHGTTPSGVDISDSDMGFAWNAGAGLSIPIFSRGTSMDVGYRYAQTMGLEFTALDGTKSKTDIGGHEVTFSLRQRF
jgi:hypothetical protein